MYGESLKRSAAAMHQGRQEQFPGASRSLHRRERRSGERRWAQFQPLPLAVGPTPLDMCCSFEWPMATGRKTKVIIENPFDPTPLSPLELVRNRDYRPVKPISSGFSENS